MSDTTMYDNLLEVVQKRRSNRQFKPDPIPLGYIEKIVDAARWAPSGFHTQPWEFVAVTRKDVRDKVVAALHEHTPPITDLNTPHDTTRASFRDAPAFIIALCDWRACVGLPGQQELNSPRVVRTFDSSMASAFLVMQLAATSLGLASQWYSGASRGTAEPALRAIIGVPESLRIYDLMVLGYPAAPPVAKEVRNLKDLLHYDGCGEGAFRTDEQVAAEAAKTKAWCLSAH